MNTISGFHGEYRWLSNFWPAPITYGNITAPTTEHLYQASKAAYEVDAHRILAMPTPGGAKKLGSRILIKSHWEQIKKLVMYDVTVLKYQQHADLRQKLLDTGEASLIETNKWGDTYWGVYQGRGFNHLGSILMDVRDQLRAQSNG